MHLAAILLLLTTTLFPHPTQSLYLRPLPHAPNTKAPRAVLLDWDDAPIVKRDPLATSTSASLSPSPSPSPPAHNGFNAPPIALPYQAETTPKRSDSSSPLSPPENDPATRRSDANTPIPNVDDTNPITTKMNRRSLPDEADTPSNNAPSDSTTSTAADTPEAIYARDLAIYNRQVAARAEWDRVQAAIARISARAGSDEGEGDEGGGELEARREGSGEGEDGGREDALRGSEEVWRRDLLRRLALLEGRDGEEIEEGEVIERGRVEGVRRGASG